jgi:alkyldihydroxyacetonephosphate synthase
MAVEFVSVSALAGPDARAQALVADLAKLCSGRASASAQDRLSYARDLWPRATYLAMQGQVPLPPVAVCWPSSTAEVAAVVNYARTHQVPLVPYGAGSGVCGGALGLGGITVDLKRMESLLHVDVARLRYTAQAGIVGEVLERQLARQGLSGGHFPSSILCSTLGGWLAARGAGQLSTKYGKIEDMTERLTAVLGTGEVIEAHARPGADADLLQVLIGSEGTLGLITEATMYAVPQPAHRTYLGLRFRTLDAGSEAIRRILRDGLRPAVVRLYDPLDTALVGKGAHQKHIDTDHPARDSLIELQERAPSLARRALKRVLGNNVGLMNRAADLLRECLLILVFEGEADLAEAEVEQARMLGRERGGVDLGPEPGRHWMGKRYNVSFKQSKIFDAGGFADTMEVAATWDKVVPVYRAVKAAVAPLGFIMAHLSHAYLEGCSLYFTFTGTARTAEETLAKYDLIWERALAAAMAAGANVSHHHGVGLSKATQLHRELGDGGVALLRQVKSAMDPDRVLNPGKLGL